MALETSNRIKLTEDDIEDAYCPDGLASYQTGEHCVYISKADSIHEAEQIKAQIVSALKMQELAKKRRDELEKTLNLISEIKEGHHCSGSDYHLQILNERNYYQTLLEESEK